MSGKRFGIYSRNIVTPEEIIEGTLIVQDGFIKTIEESTPHNLPIVDAINQVVMPGLIDPHVHINEPGRTNWEGFLTATAAAAAGGITTLVDMPLNSDPVTVSVSALREKIAAARGQLYVNCGFYGGLIPTSHHQFKDLLQSGVLGIKVFLCHSGLDQFPNVHEEDLHQAMPALKAAGLPLLVHAELISEDEPWAGPATSFQSFLQSRPAHWEHRAIELIVNLTRKYGNRSHIVHLSSAESLAIVKEAKQHCSLTAETCPHYLYFNSEDIPNGQPQFKCAPPIRDRRNNLQLWDALMDGSLDFVATDHSPCLPDLKYLDSGNLQNAWGGIGSLQFLLPLIWTLGKSRGMSLKRLSEIVSSKAADFLELSDRKGKIKPGYDADLVVWDPEGSFKVVPEIIRFKHPVTPFMNETLTGVVTRTYVKGNLVYSEGNLSEAKQGELILNN